MYKFEVINGDRDDDYKNPYETAIDNLKEIIKVSINCNRTQFGWINVVIGEIFSSSQALLKAICAKEPHFRDMPWKIDDELIRIVDLPLEKILDKKEITVFRCVKDGFIYEIKAILNSKGLYGKSEPVAKSAIIRYSYDHMMCQLLRRGTVYEWCDIPHEEIFGRPYDYYIIAKRKKGFEALLSAMEEKSEDFKFIGGQVNDIYADYKKYMPLVEICGRTLGISSITYTVGLDIIVRNINEDTTGYGFAISDEPDQVSLYQVIDCDYADAPDRKMFTRKICDMDVDNAVLFLKRHCNYRDTRKLYVIPVSDKKTIIADYDENKEITWEEFARDRKLTGKDKAELNDIKAYMGFKKYDINED